MDKAYIDKEYISLVYIADPECRGKMPEFTKKDGFLLRQSDTLSSGTQLVQEKKPDLVLMDADAIPLDEIGSVLKGFSEYQCRNGTAVFIVFSSLPDPEERLKLLEMGVNDILVRPFLTGELKEKFKIYSLSGDLLQKDAAQVKQLSQAEARLDGFTQKLEKLETDLFEERCSLNSALKQVQQMTLERSRLKEENAEAAKAHEENIQGFFEILCRLVEIRVEKNRGHGERVAHIADFIGRKLKLDEIELGHLQKAAMLHEIGYLFIPEEISLKPDGQLSEYEKDLFVQFPVKGAELLTVCSEFEEAANIIRHLHENSDGSGRPEGMKRRYIPLSSRILAGADLFDSLKDEKGITGLENFLEQLETYSGSRLDPAVVAWLEKYAVLHMGADAYRVKGVGIHQLKPGMTLGTAIFTNTGTKLFSVNTLLTPDAIDKIKKYNRAYPVDETVYIRA